MHGGRKQVGSSGVYFGSLNTFLLSVKLENIRIGTSLNILVTQNSKTYKANRYFRTRNMLPQNNADVTHCGKTKCFILFKTKQSTELKTGQQVSV